MKVIPPKFLSFRSHLSWGIGGISFFLAVTVSALQYDCTSWSLKKLSVKKKTKKTPKMRPTQ